MSQQFRKTIRVYFVPLATIHNEWDPLALPTHATPLGGNRAVKAVFKQPKRNAEGNRFGIPCGIC